jgi:hypothetical protein
MKIHAPREPIVGERFEVTVVDFSQPLFLSIHIGSKRVSFKECDDPPCHEMLAVPAGTKGAILTVIAQDAAGDRETLELFIREMDRGVLTAGA